MPRIDPLNIWICQPSTRKSIWENDDEEEVNLEVKDAMTEFGSKYRPTEVTVELEEGKKKYKITIVLKAIGE